MKNRYRAFACVLDYGKNSFNKRKGGCNVD